MTRTENDSLGPVEVPKDAYYGSHTARSIHNFPISGIRNHKVFVDAIVTIKKAAARVHEQLGLLEKKKAQAIAKSCDELLQSEIRISKSET